MLILSGNRELNLKRRELLRPHLNAQFSALCNASTPISTELFGDDVRKEIDEAAKANRLGKKLASIRKVVFRDTNPTCPREDQQALPVSRKPALMTEFIVRRKLF